MRGHISERGDEGELDERSRQIRDEAGEYDIRKRRGRAVEMREIGWRVVMREKWQMRRLAWEQMRDERDI